MRLRKVLICRACGGCGSAAVFIGRRPEKCRECKGSGRWIQSGYRVVKSKPDRFKFSTVREASLAAAQERFGGEA